MPQVKLEFPLDWEYKIIALNNPETLAAICQALKACGFNQKPKTTNVSKKGVYLTYTVSMAIQDQNQLKALSQALSQCPGVKFLL